MLQQFFRPNARVRTQPYLVMVILQIVLALAIWMFSKSELLPNPVEILGAMKRLATEDTLIHELITSTSLSLQAMFIAVLLSLLISYATVMPFFRPQGGVSCLDDSHRSDSINRSDD